MYYILFYKTVENYIERRLPYRDEHLKYANDAHKKGTLIMAEAMAEPSYSAFLYSKGTAPTLLKTLQKMIFT